MGGEGGGRAGWADLAGGNARELRKHKTQHSKRQHSPHPHLPTSQEMSSQLFNINSFGLEPKGVQKNESQRWRIGTGRGVSFLIGVGALRQLHALSVEEQE